MITDILKACAILLPYPAMALLVSLLLTRFAIFLLPRLGYMDIPHGRHQHEKPVPRGGGVAIWISFFAVAGIMLLMLDETNHQSHASVEDFISNLFLPALLILITGLLDDRLELKSYVKLLVQVGAGLIFYFNGCGIDSLMGWDMPAWLALPVTVCWSVGIINAFNLIDGLDGIAAGLASISSFLLAIWTLLSGGSVELAMVLFVFTCSCLGFLRYNFSPAKIFMGDTGSMFLGLFFAYVSMHNSAKAVTLTSLLVPLMAVGIPVFDVFLAVWRRFFRRYIRKDPESNIMKGDHDHLHHRILKETGQQRKTAYIIYGLSAAFAILAMLTVFLEKNLPALVFLMILVTIFTIIRYANIEIYDTLTCVADGVRIPHRNVIFTALHPVIDCVLVILAFFCSRFLYGALVPEIGHIWWIFTFVAPITACLCLSGIYRTFWLRVGIRRYYQLGRCLVIGGVISFGVNYLLGAYYLDFSKTELWGFSGIFLAFFMIALCLITMERFLIHYFESFGYRRLYLKNHAHDQELKEVIIYGGGLHCRLYISSLYCGFTMDKEPCIIRGIVDDNKALQKLNVYGFDVIGTSRKLERIYNRKPFHEIILTTHALDPENEKILRDFAAAHNVRIRNFICRLEDADGDAT